MFISLVLVFFSSLPPPRFTLTNTLFPYTTLFRSRRALLLRPLCTAEQAWWCLDGWRARQASYLPGHAADAGGQPGLQLHPAGGRAPGAADSRSEEHTSELQSLMRISYAVFCLKKKTQTTTSPQDNFHTSNIL